MMGWSGVGLGYQGNVVLRVSDSGNVGIGTTNPGYKLDVAGDINFTGTLRQNGTPFSGSQWVTTSTGIYYNSGNVGIGTTAPGTSKLRVVGTIGGELNILSDGRLTIYQGISGGNGQMITLNGDTTVTPFIRFAEPVSSGIYWDLGMTSSSPTYFKLKNGSTDVITVNGDNNNIGIGTTNPSRKLTIANAGSRSTNTQLFYLKQPDDYGYSFNIDDLNTGRMFIYGVYAGEEITNPILTLDRTTGNVGIGTTTPYTKLYLKDSSSGPIISLSGSNSNYRGISIRDTYGFEQWFSGANDSGNFVIRINNIEDSITISSSTNYVGIGTTNPQSALEVSNYPGRIRIKDANIGGKTWELQTRAGSTLWGFGIKNVTDNIQAVTIEYDGRVGIGTTTPQTALSVVGTIRQTNAVNCALSSDAYGSITCTSDERLKNIKGEYTEGLDAILGINPIRFQYNGEDYTHIGFSAQNVQKFIPEAAPLQKNGYLGIDSNAITAALINAVKEQQKEIEILRKEIEILKSSR